VLPLKRAIVGSAVDGRVVELAAEEGQRVEKNQPLVQLLTNTIDLELVAAKAELELRKQQLAEFENGSRPNDIERVNARMLSAQARMAYTKAQRDRLENLRSSRAISQEELDEARTLATQAEQSFYESQAAYELAVEGPRLERIAQARAQMAIQQAVVYQIEDRISKYTIISRFDGYVVAKHVEEGAWAKAGDPVMEVVALDEVDVEAFVTEQNVPYIELGMSVRVEIPALPERAFLGAVTAIVPQADTRARTFPIKIRVKNVITEAGPLLKAGMYARVELPTGSLQQALMVPKDALVLGGTQPLVYVVERGDGKQGMATAVPVTLGVAAPNSIQVRGSLQAGQWVVVEGNERLRHGQAVVVTQIVRPTPGAAGGH